MLLNPFQPTSAMMRVARAGRPAAILIEEEDLDDAPMDGGPLVLVRRRNGVVRRHSGCRPSAPTSFGTAMILSTSGTTGEPKTIAITDRTLAVAIEDIGLFNLGFGDRPAANGRWAPLLQYSPLAHIGGAVTLLRGIARVRPVVMLGKFDPHRWADVVTEYRPVTTGLPPAMMRMLLDAQVPCEALSSLVSVWSGSAPVEAATATAFMRRYGLPVLGNYGATEFCGAVAACSLEDHRSCHSGRAAAVGRIRPSIANARIRALDDMAILPLGEIGVLEFQVHRIGAAWLATTDLARLDADGFLYLSGRRDDAIVRGGFKIAPDTIASALRKDPSVRDVAVVGIADARLGQVPVAAVVLHQHPGDGSKRIEAYLIAAVRNTLPAYFVPVVIRIVTELPRTAAMKIDRRAVRALFEI